MSTSKAHILLLPRDLDSLHSRSFINNRLSIDLILDRATIIFPSGAFSSEIVGVAITPSLFGRNKLLTGVTLIITS